MAPTKFLFLAAIALESSFLGSAGSTAVTDVTEVTDHCITALNLARAGKLDVRQKLLTKGSQQEIDKFKQELTAVFAAGLVNTKDQQDSLTVFSSGVHVRNGKACTIAQNVMPSSSVGTSNAKHGASHDVHGLLVDFPVGDDFNAKKCAELIQKQITKALEVIKEEDTKVAYAKEAANSVSDPYATSAAAQNFAYMMYSNATTVGCAIGAGCQSGTNALLCRFEQSVDKDKTTPPFPKDFYNALKARAAANISIENLKPEDIDTPLTSSGKLISAAAAFVASLFAFISN